MVISLSQAPASAFFPSLLMCRPFGRKYLEVSSDLEILLHKGMFSATRMGTGSIEACERRRWPWRLASLLKAETSSWSSVDLAVKVRGNKADMMIFASGWLRCSRRARSIV
jgi:hypothetical protein